jgi:endonuclease I
MKFVFGIAIFTLSIQLIIAQPQGYYDDAYGLTGEDLKEALHTIIKDHIEYSYDDLKEILKETDEDPDNPNNIILLYTGRSQDKNTFGGGANDWNREHVWAKSHGDFGDNPPCGTDIHHMRPTDASVNSSRGNKDFDNGGIQHPEATGCYYTEYTWEPRDEVKGDVARMIFYMEVRYEGDGGELDLEVVDWVNTSPNPEHGKFSTLYEWHQQDPPDDFEINRNEVIYSYQNNRNPFIDHPEFLINIYEPTIGTQESTTSNQIKIYPNPTSEFISVANLPSDLKNWEISISNIYGKELLKETSYGQESIKNLDVSTLPNGLYILSLLQENQIFSRKFQVKR